MKTKKKGAPSFLGALSKFRLECAREIEFLDRSMKADKSGSEKSSMENADGNDAPKGY